MALYAVIDTNVMVSALLSSHNDTATVQVVDRLFSGVFIPLVSKEILDEYNEVLRRDKFGFSEEVVSTLISVIRETGIMVMPSHIDEVLPDMKDLPFYEVVIEKQEVHPWLVTGNIRYFPVKPFVVTAKEFLNIIEQDS